MECILCGKYYARCFLMDPLLILTVHIVRFFFKSVPQSRFIFSSLLSPILELFPIWQEVLKVCWGAPGWHSG